MVNKLAGSAGLGVEWDDARATQGQFLLGREARSLLLRLGDALRASGLAGDGADADDV